MDINDKKNISGAQFTQPKEEFQVRSASSAVRYDFQEVLPPAQSTITVDDLLQVQCTSGNSFATFLINVRILGLDGLVHPLQFSVTTVTAFIPVFKTFQLMEGYLLSLTVVTTANFNEINPNFAVVSLVRIANSNISQYSALCSGYVSGRTAIGWPTCPPQPQLSGMGQVMINSILTVTTPGAGADFIYTMPGAARIQIRSISALFTTAATVANRTPSLVLDDGSFVYGMFPSGNTEVATNAVQYTWADSTPIAPVFDNKVIAPLASGVQLPPGHRVRSLTTGIQAGDTWTNIFMQGHVWLDVG